MILRLSVYTCYDYEDKDSYRQCGRLSGSDFVSYATSLYWYFLLITFRFVSLVLLIYLSARRIRKEDKRRILLCLCVSIPYQIENSLAYKWSFSQWITPDRKMWLTFIISFLHDNCCSEVCINSMMNNWLLSNHIITDAGFQQCLFL